MKKRVVDFIDIATDKQEDKVYKKEEDPQHFRSKKTGRGPFKKGWQVAIIHENSKEIEFNETSDVCLQVSQCKLQLFRTSK